MAYTGPALSKPTDAPKRFAVQGMMIVRTINSIPSLLQSPCLEDLLLLFRHALEAMHCVLLASSVALRNVECTKRAQ